MAEKTLNHMAEKIYNWSSVTRVFKALSCKGTVHAYVVVSACLQQTLFQLTRGEHCGT